MPKVHFTPKYTYPNDWSIRAISACGLHSGIVDKNFIDCTIVETRVNCKNCLRVINAAKKLQQPPVSNSASKPHCWGKMTWILKYPSGLEPKHSICRCEHGSLKCKLLTRQNAR